MSWQKYRISLRLLSPLHIGFRKVGNLMQTRCYVPGKVLWASLTARLTRDLGKGGNEKSYITVGQDISEFFRFEYLYPALPLKRSTELNPDSELRPYYFWEDESLFYYLFLDSYAGTALNYDQGVAAEGQLREVEFIRPWTRTMPGNSQTLPVYLLGCLYVHQDVKSELLGWVKALDKIQLGGERGYGWGRVQLESLSPIESIEKEPVIEIKKNDPVLAHTTAPENYLEGQLEPLVGWERDNDHKNSRNWRLSSARICYMPGSCAKSNISFIIGQYGIWKNRN